MRKDHYREWSYQDRQKAWQEGTRTGIPAIALMITGVKVGILETRSRAIVFRKGEEK